MSFLCCRTKSIQQVTYEETEEFVLPIHEGKVIKVYDGDTITIAFHLYGKLYRKSVRLYGIDTPEIKAENESEKSKAKKARDALVSKVLYKVVTLKNLNNEKYGRLLAEVWIDNENVSDWMVKQGHAVLYNGKTKNKQQWSMPESVSYNTD